MKSVIDRRVFYFAPEAKRWIVLTFFSGLLGSLANIAMLLLVGKIIVGIYDGRPLFSMVDFFLGMLLAMILRAISEWSRDISSQHTAGAVKLSIRRQLYQHMLQLGPSFLEHKNTGALSTTIVDGVEALDAYVGLYIPYISLCLVMPSILFLGFSIYVDLVSAVILIAFVPLVPLSIFFFNNVEKWKVGTRVWKAYLELSAYFSDSLQGLTTLKLFDQVDSRGIGLNERAVDLETAYTHSLRLYFGVSFFCEIIPVLGYSTTLIVDSIRLSRGELALGTLTTVLFVGPLFYEHISHLLAYHHYSLNGRRALDAIFELMNTKPDVQDVSSSFSPSIEPSISFEQVSFTYDGERQVLQDLSLEVHPGECVALVGATGAGKSTVIDLLYRFHDPNNGRVLFGGLDISSLPLKFLRSQMALVAQDAYLFYDTVENNLCLGNPNASKEELVQAARAANAHDFIQALPQGYATVIGERGTRLSGGERQRIAIARALLKDAPILILDEPTSNVDAENEACIQRALDHLSVGRTVLVIAHRLSTIRNADRILVMDQGRIMESGTHEELLALGKIYAHLIAAQCTEPLLGNTKSMCHQFIKTEENVSQGDDHD